MRTKEQWMEDLGKMKRNIFFNGPRIEMGIVNVKEVLELIEKKPEKVELILTGGQKIRKRRNKIYKIKLNNKVVQYYNLRHPCLIKNNN